MKLVSFNIGIKIDNSKAIGEFIESQKPDIVAFQEIIRHFDDSVFDMYKSKSDIEKIIGKRLSYSFFGPQWIADAMRKNGKMHRDFNGFVEQGNEVISKFPIITAVNEHYHKQYSLELEWANFYTEDHPRSVQIVELDINGKALQVLNLHGLYSKGKLDSDRSIAQCEYVLDATKRKDIPTIIVGDFNLFPDTESIRILNKEFRNLINEYSIVNTTCSDYKDDVEAGDRVVDYIFVNDKINVNSFEVIDTNISDHLPLILDFDIND
ncbi:endonuclease/exonuclease/phosphatase family protein [Patescibacteria group bacterium]|nr:endonuclease/exonuclease/phosphatase family protein [Patescibacteria group bacterium]